MTVNNNFVYKHDYYDSIFLLCMDKTLLKKYKVYFFISIIFKKKTGCWQSSKTKDTPKIYINISM